MASAPSRWLEVGALCLHPLLFRVQPRGKHPGAASIFFEEKLSTERERERERERKKIYYGIPVG